MVVLEYLTAGGVPWNAGDGADAALRAEGHAMMRAAVRDLTIETTARPAVCLGAGVPAPEGDVEIVRIHRDPWDAWRGALRGGDAALVIAPESDGVLEELSRLAEEAGASLLGSSAPAVRQAASKTCTARTLQALGVPVAPSWPRGEHPRGRSEHWVVKPDDGIGSAGVRVCRRLTQAIRLRDGGEGDWVVQPWVPGPSRSVVVEVRPRASPRILAVNDQRVVRRRGALEWRGVRVNARRAGSALRRMVEGVVEGMPGLRGLVGIDYIAGPRGPCVVDVNPRVTSSCIGLREATGRGIGAALLCAPAEEDGAAPPGRGRAVRIGPFGGH